MPEMPKSEVLPSVVQVNRGSLVPAENFALIANPNAIAALKENLAGERISEFDLDRIKVPGSGGIAWEIPTLEGPSVAPTIEGLILGVFTRRGYWESSNVDGSPPDCFSIDGINGTGTPSGECAGCPFNEFGSAVRPDGSQGTGKRCKERRLIFVLRKEDMLPVVISAPPTSIKIVKQFLMRLPVASYQAYVKFGLKRVQGNGTPDYSVLTLTYIGALDETAAASVRAYVKTINAAITSGVYGADFANDPQEQQG